MAMIGLTSSMIDILITAKLDPEERINPLILFNDVTPLPNNFKKSFLKITTIKNALMSILPKNSTYFTKMTHHLQ